MTEEAYVVIVQLALLLLLLVLPIIVAFWRGHPNRWVIFIITVVFGATVLGWLIALVWSLHGAHRSRGQVADGGESGLNLFANDPKMVQLTPPTYRTDAAEGRNSVRWAVEEIERLRQLRDQSHISGSEYDMLKAGILERLRS